MPHPKIASSQKRENLSRRLMRYTILYSLEVEETILRERN